MLIKTRTLMQSHICVTRNAPENTQYA